MISLRLDTALREAIQAHADHHRNGTIEIEKVLSALGEIAASYIVEVPQGSQRQHLYSTLGRGIAQAVNSKLRTLEASVLPKS